MKISEITIDLVKPKEGLIGFASLVIEESIYLGNIGIVKRLDEDTFRLTYPTRKVGDKSFNIYYPINKESGKKIEKAVTKRLKEVLKKNDRHNNPIYTSNEDGYR
jgi:DNA-binding cell septation regulator SpoVG